ncbi:MAG: bifunctional aconitate hydratase 2/2-methylisocitrate dehydratase [Thiomargarita sp.]|nr:bifunctional aconitate hydratase 2/2-methylisocitrate dehydratase [Thiomargarita sp.]
MLETYNQHVAERASKDLPPLALDAEQVSALVEQLKNNSNDSATLLDLLTHRVPPGVDEAAYVKANFLAEVAKGQTQCTAITPTRATELLGTMLGGYNIEPLIDLLDNETQAETATKALSHTLLMFDAYHDVVEKAKNNDWAKKVIHSWAEAEWFTSKSELPEAITVTVFKVTGETNTDDLSPASEAWSRPDIPLHAQAILINRIDNALDTIAELKKKGHPLAYVGDVVGTGSSRKSAINSLLWYIGKNIPYVPNKCQGGVVLGGKIAPIFFNTAEDSGALPIECDISLLNDGDVITIYPHKGYIANEKGEELIRFKLRPVTMPDEMRAGGRIPLIIGRSLTDKARQTLGLEPLDLFILPEETEKSDKGFTLAQKMVGKACGVAGIRPGTYCEPKITTVGSQDTTGAMTRDEMKELACLGFSADLVMQSFCHTAAYPKSVDIKLHHQLPDFIQTRGGVALRPGDGVIHSWLNRMVLPDTVGTGGDSHTRFPIGISFPAGSGLVAFAAALGTMPIDMPESVLVRFTGEMQPGVTLRDLVGAIPYVAIQKGLLTVEKKGKKNIFSGRIIEIEGLPDLKVEQAFELADSSAERSATACTVRLAKEPVIEFLSSNVTLLRWLIANDYGDKRTLQRRIDAMEAWLANPELLEPDADAEYADVLEINLNEIKEPIVACPNDPDDVKLLSDVAGVQLDDVFIGSCMTNIGHYRAASKILEDATTLASRLWIAPPTKMDEHQLMEEGIYSIFGRIGARTEMPGCSLCMGNQVRIKDDSTVVSSSTRNFPNRLGKNTNVYLASAELAAVCAKLGKIPTLAEYQQHVEVIKSDSENIYRYLNFHEIESYQSVAKKVIPVTSA